MNWWRVVVRWLLAAIWYMLAYIAGQALFQMLFDGAVVHYPQMLTEVWWANCLALYRSGLLISGVFAVVWLVLFSNKLMGKSYILYKRGESLFIVFLLLLLASILGYIVWFIIIFSVTSWDTIWMDYFIYATPLIFIIPFIITVFSYSPPALRAIFPFCEKWRMVLGINLLD